MRTIMLGAKGWIVLGLVAIIAAGGVWAWQAGYGPEIGKFFAADFGGAPVSPELTYMQPGQGPVGTLVSLHGRNLPAADEISVHFGPGTITAQSSPTTTSGELAFVFTVPSEMAGHCIPGMVCTQSLIPVKPGDYQVTVENTVSCSSSTPTPDPRYEALLNLVGDATRQAMQQHPELVAGASVVTGRESEFVGAVCSTPLVPCHPNPNSNRELIVPVGGSELTVAVIAPDNTILIPGQVTGIGAVGIEGVGSENASIECGTVTSNALTFTVTQGTACIPLPPCAYEGDVRCAVDPLPGTVFCPPPSGPPTPSNCIPLPSCVNDPVAPCSVRPAPGTTYCIPTPTPTRPPTTNLKVKAPNGGESSNYNDPITVTWNSNPLPLGYAFQLAIRSASVRANSGYYLVDRSQRTFTFTSDLVEQLRRFVPSGEDMFVAQVFVVADSNTSPEIAPPFFMDESDRPFIIRPAPMTPTPSNPPGALGRVDLHLDTQQSVVSPGGEWQVRLWLDSHGVGVTGANMVLFTASNASFVQFQPTPDLPEMLAKPNISPDQVKLTFALGSGPRQGGVNSSHINLGTVTLHVDNIEDLRNNPAGDGLVILGATDGTAISIVGSERNELNGFQPIIVPIRYASALSGDLDGDGDVDIFDYNLVVSNFKRPADQARTPGDADGDGDVDIFDYNIVVSNFGRTQ